FFPQRFWVSRASQRSPPDAARQECGTSPRGSAAGSTQPAWTRPPCTGVWLWQSTVPGSDDGLRDRSRSYDSGAPCAGGRYQGDTKDDQYPCKRGVTSWHRLREIVSPWQADRTRRAIDRIRQ